MMNWIYAIILFFVLWMIVEELIYFSWNRYVYGPKGTIRKWKVRLFGWVVYLKVLCYRDEVEMTYAAGEKSAS